jgi:hypothetical protein
LAQNYSSEPNLPDKTIVRALTALSGERTLLDPQPELICSVQRAISNPNCIIASDTMPGPCFALVLVAGFTDGGATVLEVGDTATSLGALRSVIWSVLSFKLANADANEQKRTQYAIHF